MSIQLVGPHDQMSGRAGLEWASRANVVKSHGHPGAIKAAPDHALLIWRGRVDDDLPKRDAYIRDMNPEGYFDEQVSPLEGWGAGNPRLYVEGPNEPPRGMFPRLVEFYRRMKRHAANRGYRVTGFNAATGNYEADDVDRMREAELDLWTFHGYMTRVKGPTKWNAYRPLEFWRAGDPCWVMSEWGFDQCRDGDQRQMIPADDQGPFGWEKQWEGHQDPVAGAFAMLASAAEMLTHPSCRGLLLFTTSANVEWKDKKFDSDVFVPRFAPLMRRTNLLPDARTVPFTPPTPQPSPRPAPPQVEPVVGAGFRRARNLLGVFSESEVYHFSGRADEVSLAVAEHGYATWCPRTNEVVVHRWDGSIYRDYGNAGDGRFRRV